MTHVELPCGFEADIDEGAVNDMEFLDALTELQDGDITGLSKICALLFTKEDKRRFYNAIRNDAGRVELEKASGQVTEILRQLGSKKK